MLTIYTKMDDNKPISLDKKEINFLKMNSIFNSKNYNIDFYDINSEKIKINVMSNDFGKFTYTSNFKDFKQLNKYFKMFDTLKELEDGLIGLNQSKRIEIVNATESTINICINVLTLDNNKVIITLNKVEISDKEKINKILKENEEIKKELKELKEKNSKINNLEKEINELRNELISLKNKIEISNNNRTNIYNFESDIFSNGEEKHFVLNEISKHITSIKLLFSSKIYGTDVNKLIEAYLNKPHLLFLILTKKGKRFGIC